MNARLTIEERADLYAAKFPDFKGSYFVAYDAKDGERRVSATWFTGNNYKTSGYPGGYPRGYLERVMSMFPDCKDVLHAFSGHAYKNAAYRGDSIDLNPANSPTIVGDVARLPEILGEKRYELILADPPYDKEWAKRYDYKMVNRYKCVEACAKVLVKGGYLVWLDTRWPMFNKESMRLDGTINIWRCTNHAIRGVSIFRKL